MHLSSRLCTWTSFLDTDFPYKSSTCFHNHCPWVQGPHCVLEMIGFLVGIGGGSPEHDSLSFT